MKVCLLIAVVALLMSQGDACGRRSRRSTSTSTTSGNDRLTHATAQGRVNNAGITISSSGWCSDRNNGRCTSLTNIRSKCITDVIWLKQTSGCSIVITGGTETGHSSGAKSHWNGYKLDIRISTCINNYIVGYFAYGGIRSDGARLYTDRRGNIYAKEGNHWDIQCP